MRERCAAHERRTRAHSPLSARQQHAHAGRPSTLCLVSASVVAAPPPPPPLSRIYALSVATPSALARAWRMRMVGGASVPARAAIVARVCGDERGCSRICAFMGPYVSCAKVLTSLCALLCRASLRTRPRLTPWPPPRCLRARWWPRTLGMCPTSVIRAPRTTTCLASRRRALTHPYPSHTSRARCYALSRARYTDTHACARAPSRRFVPSPSGATRACGPLPQYIAAAARPRMRTRRSR